MTGATEPQRAEIYVGERQSVSVRHFKMDALNLSIKAPVTILDQTIALTQTVQMERCYGRVIAEALLTDDLVILPRALVAELLDLLDDGGDQRGMWVVEPGKVHDFTNAWEAT